MNMNMNMDMDMDMACVLMSTCMQLVCWSNEISWMAAQRDAQVFERRGRASLAHRCDR